MTRTLVDSVETKSIPPSEAIINTLPSQIAITIASISISFDLSSIFMLRFTKYDKGMETSNIEMALETDK